MRTRRYAAMNSWCAVAPLHKDPTRVSIYSAILSALDSQGTGLPILKNWYFLILILNYIIQL